MASRRRASRLSSPALLGVAVLVGAAALARLLRSRNSSVHAAEELEHAGALEDLVAQRTRELSALSTHLQQLAEKEKSEPARNLHDELGGLLTAAKMDLSWLQNRLGAEPAVQQRLQQLGAALDEAMDVKRRVVENLRPSLLDHFGLQTALRAHVETLCTHAGLACELLVEDEEHIPKDVAIALFRVLQEGLTNVLRHAAARSIRVELSSDAHAYRLRLSDDGRGLAPGELDGHQTHGIAGMRQRVRALGGRLVLASDPGLGTRLEVQIPRQCAA